MKEELNLLRKCLFVEVNLLRAEQAIVSEYKDYNSAKRKFISITAKHLEKHQRHCDNIKKRIGDLKKIRADRRVILKEQNEELQLLVEECFRYWEEMEISKQQGQKPHIMDHHPWEIGEKSK